MIKTLTVMVAAFVAGWVMVGSASVASARSGAGTCGHCRPLAPTVHVNTVFKYKTKTATLSETKTKRVARYHKIINITRIQPVIRMHKVLVVHHHTIYYTKDYRVSKVERLPAITHTDFSMRSTYDCRCH